MKKIIYMFRIYTQLWLAVFFVACAVIEAGIGYLTGFCPAYYLAAVLVALALVMALHAVAVEIAFVKRWG